MAALNPAAADARLADTPLLTGAPPDPDLASGVRAAGSPDFIIESSVCALLARTTSESTNSGRNPLLLGAIPGLYGNNLQLWRSLQARGQVRCLPFTLS